MAAVLGHRPLFAEAEPPPTLEPAPSTRVSSTLAGDASDGDWVDDELHRRDAYDLHTGPPLPRY